MPTSVADAFGNVMEVCSISHMVKAQLPKQTWESEAAWMQQVKKSAYYTLRQKIKNGELPKNVVVGRDPTGRKLVWKGGKKLEMTKPGTPNIYHYDLEIFDQTLSFQDIDWDFGPNMAQMAKQAQAIVNTPAKLTKWIKEDPEALDLDLGDVVGSVSGQSGAKLGDVSFNGLDSFGNPKYILKYNDGSGTELLDYDSLEWYHKNPNFKIDYKVGQTPPVPAAAKLPPVASTSKSTGLLTNEEAATYFVKVKDQLALEKGINIKGASAKLDELVYKTIADQTGYTPAELLAKVEAYKGTGKKLSALKKKVMKDSGNAKQEVTAKAVHKAAEAVKKEEIKPQEVVQVWDDEAVAKAYIKAKDHVVATNDKGWTLYTKNDDFDAAIHKWMQADLGPIKKEVADTAVANYIATQQKLSVLKKQMIKKGELKPQADTLKKKKGSTAEEAGDGEVGGSTAEKPAPTETGAGQVGKTTEDPSKISPKQQLSDEAKGEIKTAWEASNLPLSSSGEKIVNTAKVMAKSHGLGEDILPVLRWVDEYKAEKFGVPNGHLYEKKALEYLANPKPAYTPPTSSYFTGGHMAPESFGELPEDSTLFKAISPQEMTQLHRNSMGEVTLEQRQALTAYSGSYYHEINSHLRNGGSLSAQRQGKLIEDSMFPMPADITARRGTSIQGLGMHSMEDLKNAVGKTFVEPGFSSTAVGGSGQFSKPVNLVIQIPKGTRARWLQPYSHYQHENELLLAANTRFKILKVDLEGSGYGAKATVHVRVEP